MCSKTPPAARRKTRRRSSSRGIAALSGFAAWKARKVRAQIGGQPSRAARAMTARRIPAERRPSSFRPASSRDEVGGGKRQPRRERRKIDAGGPRVRQHRRHRVSHRRHPVALHRRGGAAPRRLRFAGRGSITTAPAIVAAGEYDRMTRRSPAARDRGALQPQLHEPRRSRLDDGAERPARARGPGLPRWRDGHAPGPGP